MMNALKDAMKIKMRLRKPVALVMALLFAVQMFPGDVVYGNEIIEQADGDIIVVSETGEPSEYGEDYPASEEDDTGAPFETAGEEIWEHAFAEESRSAESDEEFQADEPGDAVAEAGAENAEVTVMIYMIGSDLEKA